MYEAYFGLKKKPFSIVPDPHCFFPSGGHREALAHLLYGIESDGGFVLLTGEVGAGKTTVCRRFLEMIPDNTEVALVLNPKVSSEELLATICDEFRIAYPEGTTSTHLFVSRINEFLLALHAKGGRAIVIIEEAQNLRPDVLEQIRLLTNLETNRQKLLQIIMLGQPELKEMLAAPQLKQLSQRITARYHLGPLSSDETASYVTHRLSMAGSDREHLFPRDVMGKLFHLSGGVPRLVNAICDRALLGTYVEGKERVDTRTLVTAAREVTGAHVAPWRPRSLSVLILAGLLLAGAAGGVAYHLRSSALWLLSAPRSSPGEHFVRSGVAAARSNLERPASGMATRSMALRSLFDAWHVEYADGSRSGDVSQQAGSRGLRVVEGKGSVTTLREMNKPALLRMVDDKSGFYYGTLTALADETATVAIGGETRSVDVKELLRWWSGDYLLLWRPPPGYKEELRPGGRGAIVAWLEHHLGSSPGGAGRKAVARPYQGELVRKVQRFQLGAGLVPDGVVGPRTLMRLAEAEGEPTLTATKGRE